MTALGIDNNGALVFPYGKEDEDYRTDSASSGWAFNGAGSIFWRRLRTTFAGEITTVMNTANKDCFSAQNLIDEFDRFLNCFPEEIWRLDIERKYIRTFTGASIDNSVTTGKLNPRFLTSMMQGRKKYQRRQWIRNQSVYFNSKYLLSDIETNTSEFNIITPTGDLSALAVRPEYNLKLIPYQDMYLNVTIGNGGPTPAIRAKAGQEYTLDLLPYSSGTFAETRLYIRGSDYLSAIGNLAPMYPYEIDLRVAHIKSIDIGTDVAEYVNQNLNQLKLPAQLPLLETLNIKNCHTLAGGIDVASANNLRVVEAAGSAISGINIPDYSKIETLHLPSTVSSLSLQHAYFLKDFSIVNNSGAETYSGLSTLHVIDSDRSADLRENDTDPLPVDWMAIATAMIRDRSNVALDVVISNIYSGGITNIDELSLFETQKKMAERFNGQIELSGYLHVYNSWSEIERDHYTGTDEDSVWPELHLVTHLAAEPRYLVTYKYPAEVYNGREIYKMYVPAGTPFTDIYSSAPFVQIAGRDSTPQATYEFGQLQDGEYMAYSGWRREGTTSGSMLTEYIANNYMPSRINSNLTVEALYYPTIRYYRVRWFLKNGDSTPISTSSLVAYGGGETLEAPTVSDIRVAVSTPLYEVTTVTENNMEYIQCKIFSGWEKLPININPDGRNDYYDIYGKWVTFKEPKVTFWENMTFSPQLLAYLEKLNPEDRALLEDPLQKLFVGDTFTMNMGYEGVEPGTLLIGPGSEYTLTTEDNRTYTKSIGLFEYGSTVASRQPVKTDIRPFADPDDNGFTIAIDYSFNTLTIPSNVRESILMSCYSKVSNTVYGFKLYCNASDKSIRFGFGDTLAAGNTASIVLGNSDTATCRNMLVIRHPQGSDLIYLYTGVYAPVNASGSAATSDNVIPDCMSNENVHVLSWSAINTDAPLIFGALTFESSQKEASCINGNGTVYYAKYWNKDLGAGECKQLAAWIHEPVTFAVQEFVGSTTPRTGFNNANVELVFTTLTSSSYKSFSSANPRSTTTPFGWSTSELHTLINKRIFNGMPILMQSVIAKTPVLSNNTQYSSDNNLYGQGSYTITGGIVTGNDFLFAPTIQEFGDNLSGYTDNARIAYAGESEGAYPWINAANIVAKQLYATTNTWTDATITNLDKYMNLRFPYIPISLENSGNTIYFDTVDHTSSYTVYELIGANNIKRGDIYVRGLGAMYSAAYIYVDSSDVANGAPIMRVDSTSEFSCPNGAGGWIKFTDYLTRSPITSANTSSTGTFIAVNHTGATVSSSGEPTSYYNYIYSFTIGGLA